MLEQTHNLKQWFSENRQKVSPSLMSLVDEYIEVVESSRTYINSGAQSLFSLYYRGNLQVIKDRITTNRKVKQELKDLILDFKFIELKKELGL
jgi:hypothetical protein